MTAINYRDLLLLGTSPRSTPSLAEQALIAANAAQGDAAAAQTTATNATTELTKISSDAWLSKSEKPALLLEWQKIDNEYAGILASASNYGVTSSTYSTAKTDLANYLNLISLGWSDVATDSPIVAVDFRAAFNNLYASRQALLDAIAAEAGKRAVWATGISGRPADNLLLNPQEWEPIGGVLIEGSTITSNAAGWANSAAYGTGGTGGAYVQGTCTGSISEKMIGLCKTATPVLGYADMDFSVYVSSGYFKVWELGVEKLSLAAAVVLNDDIAITYDGITVRYLLNGVVKYSHTTTENLFLYGKVVFGSATAKWSNLRAGTMSSSAWSAIGGVNRPADNATVGHILNDDPKFTNVAAAWALSSGINTSTTALASAVTPNYFQCLTGTDKVAYSQRRFPVDPSRTYELTASLYAGTGNNRNMYVYVEFYDLAGVYVANSGWGGTRSGYVYGGQPPIGVFTECGGTFGAGNPARLLPSTVKSVVVGVWFQYSGGGTSAVEQGAQNITLIDVTDAAIAKAAADQAQTDATTANGELAKISTDTWLSKSEKPDVVRLFNAIDAEYVGIGAQATAYGVVNTLATLRNTLSTYLTSVAYTTFTTDTVIIRADFNAAFNNYYTEKQRVLDAIAAAAKVLANNAQTTAVSAAGISLTTLGGMTIVGNMVEKTGGVDGSWDVGFRSTDSFTGGAQVSFVVVTPNTQFMIGLNTDPDTNASYGTLDFALFITNGTLRIYESDLDRGAYGAVSIGDVLSITYDGITIRYLRNGVPLSRSVPVVITAPLFVDSSFYTIGAKATNIQFSAMSSLSTLSSGANLCFNSDFSAGLNGWQVWYNPNNDAIDYCNASHTGLAAGGGTAYAINNGVGDGSTTLQIHQTNGITTGYFDLYSQVIAVERLKTYIVSAYMAGHRCSLYIFCQYLNAAGTVVGNSNLTTTDAGYSGGNPLNSYDRTQSIFTVPADATNVTAVRVALRKGATTSGQSDSWAFIGRVMLEEVGATATKAGAWCASGAGANNHNNNITINANGTLSGAGGGQVTTMPVIDNAREADNPPNFYAVGTIREFKHAAAIGLSDANGTWVTLETIKQYTDGGSGFPGYQYAYQQALTFRRRAANDAGTSWTSWVQDLDTHTYTGALDATKGAQAGVNLVDSGGNTVTDGVMLNNYTENGITHISRPIGGTLVGNPTQYGAIKIRLPMRMASTMLKFIVDIYEYAGGSDGASASYEIAGYDYADLAWRNVSAKCNATTYSRRTVRFGYDAVGSCIWIGDAGAAWAYPQIKVRDFTAAYSNIAISNWDDNWLLTFDNTAPTGVSFTVTPYNGDVQLGANVRDSAGGLLADSHVLNTYSLSKSANSVLDGVVSVNVASNTAGFVAGTLTWDASGNRTGGYGVAMTSKGFVATDGAGTVTFSANASTGSAYFGGALGAGIVNAQALAADAVTATKIQAGAVTTSKLTIQPNSLIGNSDFATGDLTNWRVYSGGANISVVGKDTVGVPVNAPTRYVAKSSYSGAATTMSLFAADKSYEQAGADRDGFAVLAGTVYTVSISAAKSADYASDGFSVIAYFYLNTGTYSSDNWTITNAPLTTSWAKYSGTFTAPTGAMRCWLHVYDNSHTAGSVYFTNLAAMENLVGVSIGTNGIKVFNASNPTKVFFDANKDSPPWVIGTADTSGSGESLTSLVDPTNNTQAIKRVQGAGSVSASSDANSITITGLGSEIDSIAVGSDLSLSLSNADVGQMLLSVSAAGAYRLCGQLHLNLSIASTVTIAFGTPTSSVGAFTTSVSGTAGTADNRSTAIGSVATTVSLAAGINILRFDLPFIAVNSGAVQLKLGVASGTGLLKAGSAMQMYRTLRQTSASAPTTALTAAPWGVTAVSGYVGAAHISFNPNGTWETSQGTNGTFLTGLPMNAAGFEIQFVETGWSTSGTGSKSRTNGASAYIALSATRTFSVSVTTPIGTITTAQATITVNIRPVGGSPVTLTGLTIYAEYDKT